jgi:hypothetical protein
MVLKIPAVPGAGGDGYGKAAAFLLGSGKMPGQIRGMGMGAGCHAALYRGGGFPFN